MEAAAEVWPLRGSPPLTAVHTGQFNRVVSRQDQGWAPQILFSCPVREVPACRGINREKFTEGGWCKARGFSPAGEPLMLSSHRVIRMQ